MFLEMGIVFENNQSFSKQTKLYVNPAVHQSEKLTNNQPADQIIQRDKRNYRFINTNEKTDDCKL